MRIIGLGNPYRGDDGVGPLIAQRIKRKEISGIEVLDWIMDAVALLDMWKDTDELILVDAAHCHHEPGTIHRFEPNTDILPSSLFPLSTHGFCLNDAIRLGKELDRMPPYFVIYAIDGCEFGMNEALTPAVRKAAFEVEKKILLDIQSRGAGIQALQD